MNFRTLLPAATLAAFATAQTPALAQNFVGAVYAMTNEFTGNHVIGYGRAADGTLTQIGSFPTGGNGAAFDGGEGLDPLISAYSLFITGGNRFILATNAGSDSVTVFRVNRDLSLTRTDVVPSGGDGPNSIAVRNRIVYVSNIDADGVFNGEPDQEGNITGFRLTPQGRLIAIPGSTRLLGNRPSAVQFSTTGDYLVVASINAGSAALASGSDDELVLYGVQPNGRTTLDPLSTAASTLPGNAANRNLPSAIGFEIVESGGTEIVVVTEAREFQADGSPPAFPALQTGSVSTWEIGNNGDLIPRQLDVMTGTDMFDGERTACWIEFSSDEQTFWVSNALESTLSAFSFTGGNVNLIDRVAAAGTGPAPGDPFGTTDGWVDLWISDDGRFLYQLYGLDGTIGVFEITPTGLNLVQELSGTLPDSNTQGIVAF